MASNPGVLLGARQAVDQTVLSRGEDGGQLTALSAGAGLPGCLPGHFLSEQFVAGVPRVAPPLTTFTTSSRGAGLAG